MWELAFQINEQFEALGNTIGVQTCVIVGGVDMMQQMLHWHESHTSSLPHQDDLWIIWRTQRFFLRQVESSF